MLSDTTTHTPSGLSGILFAEDFDDLFAAPAAAEPVVDTHPEVQTSCSLEDLDRARAEAYAAGILAAETRSEQRLRAEAETTLGCIRLLLQDSRKDTSIHLDRACEAIAQLLFATLAALLPGLCATHRAQEIVMLVRNLVSTMHREPTLCVSVHPSMIDELRHALCLILAPGDSQMALAADERIEPGDARIVWDRGTATYSSRKALDAVNAVLEQLGLSPPVNQPPPTTRPATPQPIFGTAGKSLESKQDRMEHANG